MRRIFCLAINTYRELIRSQVLYTVIFFGVLVVAVSALFGSVTVGNQIMVIKDFGLFSISLFGTAFAVIAGASLLHKELSKKTIYNILSKPVSRWEFVLGKYLGMLVTVAVIIMLMGAGLHLFLYSFQGQYDQSLSIALLYIFLEMIIICASTIFFSSIVITPLLSGLFSFGLFLAGRSVDYICYFVDDQKISQIIRSLLEILYYALPHLSKLNISHEVLFGAATLNSAHFFWAFIYSIGYASILLVVGSVIFVRKEFN